MSLEKNLNKLSRFTGEWCYQVRDYNTYGKKCKTFVSLYHKNNNWHWTNPHVNTICHCGVEIPGPLKLFIAMVDSGFWQ